MPKIQKFTKFLEVILLSFLILKTNSIIIKNHCEKIEGVGSPTNLIHEYFKQIYNVLYNQSEEKPLELLSISDQEEENEIHRLIFRLKIEEIYYYIGILSVIPKKEMKKANPLNYIIRYIQSKDVRDAQRFLGVYDINLKNELICPFDIKTEFWNYVSKTPINNVLIFEKKKKLEQNKKKNEGMQNIFKNLLNKLLNRKKGGNNINHKNKKIKKKKKTKN